MSNYSRIGSRQVGVEPLVSCGVCGAVVPDSEFGRHAGWHDLINHEGTTS